MKILVVLAHPNLAESRVNRRLAHEMEQQENVTVHRLYDVYSDEQINVAAEQQLWEAHDRIILQFPFYWISPPRHMQHMRWTQRLRRGLKPGNDHQLSDPIKAKNLQSLG
ncbi:hypothetical protein BC351_05585 [Paenibacillus ferrarius]|uniref:Flavodoxin-like fold domain-containing protein n=1 Tax=Paenibacillus ferrarius TaxID=1469647 RepID=A0A1V4HEU8_9BACL|nr:NAD(P)H-dependent oxidoreductase [Paenibacillus ferrarius]OPH53348.1 hypothetical protein BC351_05585 [Paenibacillus ferrarius]